MAELLVHNVSGDDPTGTGSSINPFLTFPAAFAVAAPGDVVLAATTGVDYTVTFVNTTKSGIAGAPITLRAETITNPPVMRPTSPYRWQGVSNWIIEWLLFDYYYETNIDNYMLKLGLISQPATICTNFVVRNCVFRHSSRSAIGGEYVHNLTIEDNLAYDLRRRIKADQGALEFKHYAHNLVIRGNVLQDIGSDGVELEEKDGLGSIGDVTIENNVFAVHRPYGVVPWHDVTTSIYDNYNVGENGIDAKRTNNGDGRIIIRGNRFTGFRKVVTDQDASGANGECIVFHNTVAPRSYLPVVENNIFEDSDQGVALAPNTGAGEGAIIRNNLFVRIADVGLNAIDCSYGMTVDHNTFIDCDGINIRFGGSAGTLVNSFRNNLFYNGGSFSRGSANIENNIGPNAYNGNSGAFDAAWVHASDVTGAPNLSGRYAPLTGSPLLNAGVNVGLGEDFIGQARDTTPAMGCYELEPALAANIIVSEDWRGLTLDGWSIDDDNNALGVDPRAGQMTPGNPWGLVVDVRDTTGVFGTKTFTAADQVRVGFWMNPAKLPMTNGNDFTVIGLVDGGVTVARIRLRYSSDDYRIAVQVTNDSAGQDYASGDTGDVITAALHYVDVDIQWASAPAANDGHIYLRIDGTLVTSNTGLDNDTFRPEELRLGAVGGLDAGTGAAENAYLLLGPIIANNDGAALTAAAATLRPELNYSTRLFAPRTYGGR